jgi:hypothetical protein
MHLLFEEDSGSSTGRRHPHNGYYAGDFFRGSEVPERQSHGARPAVAALVRGTASTTGFNLAHASMSAA